MYDSLFDFSLVETLLLFEFRLSFWKYNSTIYRSEKLNVRDWGKFNRLQNIILKHRDRSDCTSKTELNFHL